MDDADGGMPGLADQLDHLFTTIPKPDGSGFWSTTSAAEAMARKGVVVTRGYIAQLRNGRRNNPTARVLKALADLFEVPIDYFFEDDVRAKVDADITMLFALRQSGLRNAARAVGLSPEGLALLSDIVEQMRRYDNLRHQDERPD
ncbi:helix-turn-helix domain-containing protein [Micromonospora sp.]|uniref:helix-turn-helix domain-containing protein n=1 Tax=Micromonospora sp. TaxID=1876 RepID=UPI003B3AE89C